MRLFTELDDLKMYYSRWDYMIIGVTKWPFDQHSIDERQEQCDHFGDPSDQCKNEDWLKRNLTQQLIDKDNFFYLFQF